MTTIEKLAGENNARKSNNKELGKYEINKKPENKYRTFEGDYPSNIGMIILNSSVGVN